jgi:hypothetical protein
MMNKVWLGFKAFDIHELLSHFVAQHCGFYRHQGLAVELLDTTFTADEQLPVHTFSAACGAALFAYLGGADNRVVLVNTCQPMFWLYSCEGLDSIEQLAGKRVASYPPMAPPAHFLSMLTEGLAVQCVPVSTDLARLGLLKSGEVDAALISSAFPPAVMAEKGFAKAVHLGETLRVPSTGLTVKTQLLSDEPELVASMVRAHQQALQVIAKDDRLLSEVLQSCFDLPPALISATLSMIRSLFTEDGRVSDADVSQAVVTVAAHLGSDALPAAPLYDFRLLSP